MKTANQRFCPLPVSSLACAVSATVLLGLSTQAQAFQIDTGNPDLSATWDNTIKYSNAWRVNKLDHKVAVGPGTSNSNSNLDDGDRNFDRGLISNRLDILPSSTSNTKMLVHASARRPGTTTSTARTMTTIRRALPTR